MGFVKSGYRIFAVISAVIFGILLFSPTAACAEYVEDPLRLMDSVDISSWEEFFNEAQISDGSLSQYVGELLKGGEGVGIWDAAKNVFSGVLVGAREHFPRVSVLISMGVLSAVAHAVSDENKKGAISLATTVLTAVCAIVILNSISSVIDGAKYYTQRALGFTRVSAPVLSALVIATGKVATGGKMALTATAMGEVCYLTVNHVIFPLLICAVVLCLCSRVSQSTMLSGVYKGARSLCNWGISILFAVVFAIASLNGLVAGLGDSVASESIRNTLSGLSSLGGAYLSQGLDTVVSCAGAVKGALGVAGVITVACISVFPAFSILGIALLYRAAGGVLSLIGEEKISACLTDVGGIFTTVFLCVGACSVLCTVMIALIAGVS
ncbi:MAG: hypothetical protein E7315_00345 [Clostridiales bacterium]|nr:hypothetical protein [Clostridiales bacterium]